MTLRNINSIVASLSPYKPGKPIEELSRELGLTDIVKLASNENPLGASVQVKAALVSAVDELTRYPDGSGFALKKALAEKLGVELHQITLGNGSNDVLDLIARATIESDSEGIISEHSFVVYGLSIKYAGGRTVVVPALNYGCDLRAMSLAVTDKTRVIYIANPNNPTGTWVTNQELTRFLDSVPSSVWVVLDEAYFEYVADSEYPHGLKLQAKYPNLIVTRTFSKAYGLAALRVGYSVSSAEFADVLNRVRQPFNVNSLALEGAMAALGDQEFIQTSVRANEIGMAQIYTGLDKLGLKVIPSVGNFVSFDTGQSEIEVFNRLLSKGVIVRPIAEYGLPGFVRVTVGLEPENARFLEALGEVL
tara:strand:- start:239 stop:1327 length:1089 start_codon:yes stop_codon:yes gene_type:complete